MHWIVPLAHPKAAPFLCQLNVDWQQQQTQNKRKAEAAGEDAVKLAKVDAAVAVQVVSSNSGSGQDAVKLTA